MEFLKAALKGVNMSFLASYHRDILTAQTTGQRKKVTQKVRQNLI